MFSLYVSIDLIYQFCSNLSTMQDIVPRSSCLIALICVIF